LTAQNKVNTPLTTAEQKQFVQQGYVILENALDPETLTALKQQFDDWVDQSRHYTASYGEQQDGRPRFSLEPGHHHDHPALRRIASPVELSPIYLEVMRDSPAVDAVAQLIGPNIRFNNSKINSKHPGTATQVKFHQDFMFEPHTNDDLITVLYFLDELTPQNGPLEIVPGSHHGPLHDHWQDGVFTGSVSAEVATEARSQAISCYGAAGSACLMNTRLLHGSAANQSDSPRTLYIVEYCAEDSKPLQVNHIPSSYTGEVVRGQDTHRVRCSDYEMDFPEVPVGASFFEQQVKQN
jgi:ectoine hydroxylase-related dioxygenase (phytanoyl-CoA dioxygenase family)